MVILSLLGISVGFRKAANPFASNVAAMSAILPAKARDVPEADTRCEANSPSSHRE